jgi:Outer membrane efflux protein
MNIRRLIPLTALVLSAGLAFGQGAPKKDAGPKEPPKPAPGSLEDTLEKALRNSADIKAAEAKVRDAEAELNRVRQQVLTRAMALHADLNLAKRMLAVAQESLAEQERPYKAGQSAEGILAARAVVEKRRGEVEKLEAELKSLRGEFALKGPLGLAFDPDGRHLAALMPDGSVRFLDSVSGRLLGESATPPAPKAVASAEPGSMAERVRTFLETEVSFQELVETVKSKGDFDLSSLIQALLKATKTDIPIHRIQHVGDQRWNVDPEVKGRMPVGAVLQAFEDQAPEVRIVVREYGLLVTTADRVPEGAIPAVDFWRAGERVLKTAPKGPEKK